MTMIDTLMSPEFFETYLWPLGVEMVKILVTIGVVLLGVAYLTYGERKVLGAMQRRRSVA